MPTERAAKASARKSLGEFKPLIIYPKGRTEVCEQSDERAPQWNTLAREYTRGNRMARGTTYTRREDAIAAAQAVLDARLAEARERFAKYEAITNVDPAMRERMLNRIRLEMQTWGGEA